LCDSDHPGGASCSHAFIAYSDYQNSVSVDKVMFRLTYIDRLNSRYCEHMRNVMELIALYIVHLKI